MSTSSKFSRVRIVMSVPESTLPYPPIHKDKKFIVLSDWFVCGNPILTMFLTSLGWQGRHNYDSRLERLSAEQHKIIWIIVDFGPLDMTDNLGYGYEKRRQGNLDIVTGRTTFRQVTQKRYIPAFLIVSSIKELISRNVRKRSGRMAYI